MSEQRCEPSRVSGWKDAKFMRFILALSFGSIVFRVSAEIGGPARLQPWWGAMLTLLLGIGLPIYVWRNFRVLERDQ